MAFVLIYSCSTEEEETTPPPSIVATPEPEPEPTQYTLTVTAVEGGTVSTEGGTYDEGTEVTITATSDLGYEFVGWSDGEASNPRNIEISDNITLTAEFTITPENIYLNEIRRVRNEIYKTLRDEDDTIGVIYSSSIDLEDDGDLDLFVLTATPYNRSLGKSFIFKNENNFFEKINTGIQVAMNTNPLIEDFDNDGLKDIIIPNPGLDVEPFTGASDFYFSLCPHFSSYWIN